MRPHPFNELLREAFWASEDVDLFDLNSSDPASVEEWEGLRKRAEEAEENLARHILEIYGVSL
jgi:hypothetical protein